MSGVKYGTRGVRGRVMHSACGGVTMGEASKGTSERTSKGHRNGLPGEAGEGGGRPGDLGGSVMSPRRAVLPRRLYPHTSEAFVRLPLEFNGMSHVEVLQPHVWAEVMPKLHAIHFTTRKGWGCPERYERPAWTIDSAKPCPRTGPWVDGVRSAELCYCSVGHLWWRAMSSVPDSGKRKHVQQRLRY